MAYENSYAFVEYMKSDERNIGLVNNFLSIKL